MLIERQEGSEEAPGVLTLAELVKFYQCKLKEVGAENGKTNATRLRERVLEAVPDLTAHPEGRQVILASRHDIIIIIIIIINNNNNFIYIALKSNNCPKRYLITK